MATKSVEKDDSKLWSNPLVKGYIYIMVDEVTKSNMRNGIFLPKVWNVILNKLNEVSGRSFNMKQIKQKFNKL